MDTDGSGMIEVNEFIAFISQQIVLNIDNIVGYIEFEGAGVEGVQALR